MAFLKPDLTGKDPEYAVKNRLYTVFTQGSQTIELKATVFKDSLVVTHIGTTNVPMESGIDYDVLDSDIDYTAMSEMKTNDPNFNRILCKSVTVYSKSAAQFMINVQYQRLYPDQIRTAYFNSKPLNWTPELLSAMLQQLSYLELRTSKVADVTGVAEYEAKIFEEDPHMTNPDNVVVDEVHAVNTTSGKVFIHPIAGAFFEEGVVLKHPANNTTLELDKDYKIFGLDLEKTAATSKTAAVYHYIILLTPLVGDVTIDYHAFGGDPTITNIKDLRTQFLNIIAYLNEAKFLTDATLGGTKVISSLAARVESMEEEMRKLLLQGRPTYGDATTGTAITKKITAPDTQLHWWNVASLYKVDGSSDVIICDRMCLRFRTLYSKFLFDAIISVDLSDPAGYRLEVDVLSSRYPRGYVPFKDYSGINNLIRPQFRLIWNDNPSEHSGAILQIGMELKLMTTETLIIEDFSGMESCWKLDAEVDAAIMPQDELIQLPNQAYVWDRDNANSQVESTLVPFKYGHLIWVGSKALNRPDGNWGHLSLDDHFLDDYIDYTRIKKVRLELAEQDGYANPIDIEFIPGLDKMSGMVSFNYNNASAHVHLTIGRNAVTNKIEFNLDYAITAGLDAIQLDLRGVVIFV